METIYYMYTKQRKEFGRHPNFSDEAPGILFEILPEREVKLDLIERNPCVANVQVVPEMSEHEVNTEKVVFKNTGQFHKEGGWPKDIDPTEVEHTLRYRKKVEKDEDYLHAIAKLGGQTEELVKQNNAVDIYEEYFEGVLDLQHAPVRVLALDLQHAPVRVLALDLQHAPVRVLALDLRPAATSLPVACADQASDTLPLGDGRGLSEA
eukprot:gene26214-32123_t